MAAWRSRLIALYRDGSKLSQPLNASLLADDDEDEDDDAVETALAAAPMARVPQVAEKMVEHVDRAASCDDPRAREACPIGARAIPRRSLVGGHKVYLRTGEYDDGRLGEIFIDMHKEGAAFRARS